MIRRGLGVGSWALGLALVSLLPVLGLFTTTRIFYVRDLSFFFWSRHLWLRHAILSGEAPWWDPYVAGGQSAIADALNQLLMPITVAVRLLPSPVVASKCSPVGRSARMRSIRNMRSSFARWQ